MKFQYIDFIDQLLINIRFDRITYHLYILPCHQPRKETKMHMHIHADGFELTAGLRAYAQGRFASWVRL